MRRQEPVPESIGPETFIASAALECMTDVQLGRLASRTAELSMRARARVATDGLA